MSNNKKTSKIAHKKSQASHLQKVEPRSTGVPEPGGAGHRSRSNSGSSRHPPAETRKGNGKKKKSKEGREDSKDYQLKDVHILCENISQGVRSIKKEAVEDEEPEIPTSQDMEVEVRGVKQTTPSSPHKRRREETPSPESNDETINEIAGITEGVRSILLDDSSGIPLNTVKAVLDKCSMYERLLQKQIILNAKLEGEILALKECNSEIKGIKEVCDQVKDVYDRTTYTGGSKPSTTYALVVKSTKKEDPDDIIDKVSEVAQGVKIKSCRELKDGKGIVLITKEEKERSKLANKISKLTKGLKVEERSLRNPRFVIHNVDDVYDEEYIMSELHERNFDECGTLEELKRSMKIVGKRTSARFVRARHVIVEATPEYYKKVMKNGEVFIDMEVYRTAKWEDVPRCFNCHKFDHYAKDCKEKKLCWNCCKPDHLATDCKNISHCNNCAKKERITVDHAATSKLCPEYEWRLEMLRARTKPV